MIRPDFQGKIMYRPVLRMCLTLSFLAVAGTAVAQQHSGVWLMGVLHDQALQHAAEANAAHRADDAANWRAWAALYGKFARDARLRQIDARTLALNNTTFNQQEARVMVRNGIQPAADLYDASAKMWMDLAQQLASGADEVQVHFPERQLLKPIGGLAGTPWQNQGGHHASDCRALAQRAQNCRAQLSQLQQHDLVTGQSNGEYEAVRLRQCNAAQELYVAQCQQ